MNTTKKLFKPHVSKGDKHVRRHKNHVKSRNMFHNASRPQSKKKMKFGAFTTKQNILRRLAGCGHVTVDALIHNKDLREVTQ